MDWVYPAHVTCPVARHVVGDHPDSKKCEAGHIMIFDKLGSTEGRVCTPTRGPQIRDGEWFAGVVLDKVDGSEEREPITTVQFRGVTNVRLDRVAVKELTTIVQSGKADNVYGVRLYAKNVPARHNDAYDHYVATTDTAGVHGEENELPYVIGFVHTYHCNSRFAEMEIVPRYPSLNPSGGDTGHVVDSSFTASMVDAGDGDAPELVRHRSEDQEILNAASGFAMALGQKTKNPQIAVPLGSYVATADSCDHMPAGSLGAMVSADGDIEVRPGSAAHALIEGTRDRKRKAAPKIDNLDHTVMVRNGQLEDEDADFNPAGTYPAKHFEPAAVERYKKRLRSNLKDKKASSAAEYAADLGGQAK